MNGELTNIYYILKQKYPDIIQLSTDEVHEFFSFLGHNCKNYILDRTRSTKDASYFYSENECDCAVITHQPPKDTNAPAKPIHLFTFSPQKGKKLSGREEVVTFCLVIDNKSNIPQNKIICLKVNGKGFFIEIFNLKDKIETYYFDETAKYYLFEYIFNLLGADRTSTNFILKFLESNHDISDINPTNFYGLEPDYIFDITDHSQYLRVTINENGLTIDSAEKVKPPFGTFYTAYYDCMIMQELFEPNKYPVRIKG